MKLHCCMYNILTFLGSFCPTFIFNNPTPMEDHTKVGTKWLLALSFLLNKPTKLLKVDKIKLSANNFHGDIFNSILIDKVSYLEHSSNARFLKRCAITIFNLDVLAPSWIFQKAFPLFRHYSNLFTAIWYTKYEYTKNENDIKSQEIPPLWK